MRFLGNDNPTPFAELMPTTDLSRRRLMTGVLAAMVFLSPEGRGRGDEVHQNDQREIEDAFGTVTVPARPERVVAVRHHHIGNMLALGVVPVGIVPDASEFPFRDSLKRWRGWPMSEPTPTGCWTSRRRWPSIPT